MKTLLIPFFIFYILFSVSAASAAGLVPCGTTTTAPCTTCDLFVLIQNIINFILLVFAPLVTLAILYIAILFMFSGGSPSKITDAKGKLWLALWGMFWVLGSWLVINTIINVAAKPTVFPWKVWNKIDCAVSQQAILPVTTLPIPTLPAEALGEQEARNRFQQAGITINKSACPSGVAYQNVAGGCTSLNGITASAFIETVKLKNDCKCDLKITGGTELGHVAGATGHASGYKLDFQPNSALDNYVQNSGAYMGVRSDGAKQYRAPNGSVYAREGDHWDVTFKP